MMNKNVVSRLLCAGLSVSMMLSMGSVVFADDDWTIDVEAMKEEAAAKASAEKARASQVQATQEVSTIEAVATAERQQRIQIIEAEGIAKKIKKLLK